MKLSLRVTLVITLASFTHTVQVLGKHCDSYCAACWKDGSPGVDIKFSCMNGDCGTGCPSGYSGIHCAKGERCL